MDILILEEPSQSNHAMLVQVKIQVTLMQLWLNSQLFNVAPRYVS